MADSYARRLRRHSTDAERPLWQALRSRQQDGAKFRRQVRVGPYIADFLCIAAKLIVEVDGGQHAIDEAYDAERTRALTQQGYRVIRLWNNDVLDNMEGVLEVIRGALREPQSPHPDPLPRSRGWRRNHSA